MNFLLRIIFFLNVMLKQFYLFHITIYIVSTFWIEKLHTQLKMKTNAKSTSMWWIRHPLINWHLTPLPPTLYKTTLCRFVHGGMVVLRGGPTLPQHFFVIPTLILRFFNMPWSSSENMWQKETSHDPPSLNLLRLH